MYILIIHTSEYARVQVFEIQDGLVSFEAASRARVAGQAQGSKEADADKKQEHKHPDAREDASAAAAHSDAPAAARGKQKEEAPKFSAMFDRATQDFLKNFSFLFLGYHKETYFWEVVVLGRKATLALIAVAFAFDKRSQGMMGLLAVFLMTVAQARYMPYADVRLNRFEFFSLFCNAMTFFLGVFTMEAAAGSQVFDQASILAAVINIVYLVAAVAYGAF